MNKRLLLVLLPVLLFGCGQPPEEKGQKHVNPPPESETPDPDGFYTNLTQFTDVTDITAIDTGTIRLNERYKMVIEPYLEQFPGAKVLDLGSYDGRFSYAALEAGAKHVTGIEIEQAYADKAAQNLSELGIPDDQYEFIVDDIMTVLRATEPGTYDGVICAGIFYHITYHVELLAELKRLGVKWIIMDTTVLSSEDSIIRWVDGPHGLNRLEGIPSKSAVEDIATAAGFKYWYVPTEDLTSRYLWDYRKGNHISMLLYVE